MSLFGAVLLGFLTTTRGVLTLGMPAFSSERGVATHSIITSTQTPRVTADYEITAIRAYLYYEETAQFSSNDLFSLPGTLWNTPIGEGAAGSSSHTTLVVVELTGAPAAYAPNRSLEFVARVRMRAGSKRVILRRTTSIRLLSKDGKYFIPFLLYETGCAPIELSAQVRGQARTVTAERVIEFACGE